MDLETWRINYDLDRDPHDLAEFWRGYTPTGAVLALKAAVEEIERLHELLKESRDELEHYIDQEYPYRRDYPHMMAKWDGSMDIVRRIDKALTGEEGE